MPTKLVNIRELGSISISTGRDVGLWVGTCPADGRMGKYCNCGESCDTTCANCICVHM